MQAPFLKICVILAFQSDITRNLSMDILAPYGKYIITAAVILAVLLIGILVYKSLHKRVRGRKGQRLGISEYHEIDETRRLVLIRRDETEHLILIGGAQDLVVESSIRPASATEGQQEEMPRPPISLRTAPRAPGFAERRPALRPVEPPLMAGRSYDREEN
jgi:flagellar protein FliO/FliZ